MPPKKRGASEAAAAGPEAPKQKKTRSSGSEAPETNTTVAASNGGKKTRSVSVKDDKGEAKATRQSNRIKAKDEAEAGTNGEVQGKGKTASKPATQKKPGSKTSAATKTSSKATATATTPAKGKAVANDKQNKVKANRSFEVAVDKSEKEAMQEREKVEAEQGEHDEEGHDGRSYWLMKAEPESRMEKGVDVKFSIDDLMAKSEPEAWDGVRNPSARNNMRSMRKGDLAFFYHSNCKVPGIAGVMDIVQEHSTDESAFDEAHPYYDAKSSRENPKWCVVHVAFRKKLDNFIKLKELQKYSQQGGVLESMQVLKMSRLSVSKVKKKEWDFICELAGIEPVTLESVESDS